MLQATRRGSRKGFTLVEVLMVVTIIAVLATLILPRFGGQTEKAAAMEAVGIMGLIRQGLLAHHDEHGGYPSALADQTAIENTLGISYTAPRYGWSFSTDGNGNVIAARATTQCTGTLILSPDGAWNGTVDYLTTGKCWPQLR